MDTNEDTNVVDKVAYRSMTLEIAYVCQSSPEKATKITNRDGSEFIAQLMIDT